MAQKVIEVVGSSKESFAKAAENASREAVGQATADWCHDRYHQRPRCQEESGLDLRAVQNILEIKGQ